MKPNAPLPGRTPDDADAELPVRTGVAAAVFLALSLVYFLPAFLPYRQVFGTDYLAGSYPFYDFFADRFGAGALPGWMPYIYGGMPVYANPGSAFHPVHLLAEALLPTRMVLAAIYVVQFWLAGVGMFLLARELRCRPWVAFVAGTAFQFTGITMSWVYAGHDGRIMVSTMIPLFFFCLHRGVRTLRPAPFAGAAATLAMALLSFQIQNSYYLILAGFLWAVFCLFHFGLHRRPAALGKAVAMGVGAVAFAFALASVNFLPFRDYVAESPRGMEGGRGYEYSVSYSMPWSGLVGIAVPEHVGASVADPATGEPLFPPYRVEGGFRLHTEYVGAFAVVLLALGLAYSRRDRLWWFFAGLGLFVTTMALGGHTPLYRLYWSVLPGLKRFRAPDLIYYVLAFALVVMAALTLERIAALREARAPTRKAKDDAPGTPLSWVPWAAGAPVVIALLGAMVASAGAAPGVPGRAGGWMRFAVFAAAVAGVLWAWTARSLGSRGAAVLLALLTVTDLWIIDRRFFHTTDGPEQMFAGDDVVDFLAAQGGTDRTWAFPIPQAWGRGGPNGGNYPMLHGVQQAGGEHPNPLQRWVQYVGAGQQVITDWHNFLGPQERLAIVQTPQGEAISFTPAPGFLEAANVRWLVSMAPLAHPALREVHRGSALVYENTAALPRAYLVPEAAAVPADRMLETMLAGGWRPDSLVLLDPSANVTLPAGPLEGAAQVTAYEPDRVTVRTTASRPAVLVLADNFYDGWRATVDGEDAPVLRANHTFRAVAVPAGTHTVEFVFHPADLYLGFYVYLAGFGVLALYAAYGLATRLRRPRDADPAPAA